jgi:hypothetical protein
VPAGGTAADRSAFTEQRRQIGVLLQRTRDTLATSDATEKALVDLLEMLKQVAVSTRAPQDFVKRLLDVQNRVKQALWLSDKSMNTLRDVLNAISDFPVHSVIVELKKKDQDEIVRIQNNLQFSMNSFILVTLKQLNDEIEAKTPLVKAGIDALDRSINDLNDIKTALSVLTNIVGLFADILGLVVV